MAAPSGRRPFPLSLPAVRLVPIGSDQAVALWQGRSPLPAVAGYPLPGSRGGAAVVLARDGAAPVDRLDAHLVVDLVTGLVVGDATFHAAPLDGVVEVGFATAESVRGRGFATAAVAALLRLAWASVRVSMVVAETQTDNLASRTVLGRNGFTLVAEAGGWSSHRLPRGAGGAGQASPPVLPVVPAVTSNSR